MFFRFFAHLKFKLKNNKPNNGNWNEIYCENYVKSLSLPLCSSLLAAAILIVWLVCSVEHRREKKKSRKMEMKEWSTRQIFYDFRLLSLSSVVIYFTMNFLWFCTFLTTTTTKKNLKYLQDAQIKCTIVRWRTFPWHPWVFGARRALMVVCSNNLCWKWEICSRMNCEPIIHRQFRDLPSTA